MKHSRAVTRQIIMKVLAADLSCSEGDLLSDGVSVCKAEVREGRFQFPIDLMWQIGVDVLPEYQGYSIGKAI